jgi:hypothetical protein
MRATMSISTMDAISWLRGSIIDPFHGRQIFWKSDQVFRYLECPDNPILPFSE